ncbi:DUF6879 family protein [Streptomyces sp. NPDC002530]
MSTRHHAPARPLHRISGRGLLHAPVRGRGGLLHALTRARRKARRLRPAGSGRQHPATEYIRFEHACTGRNVTAGEDVHRLPRTTKGWTSSPHPGTPSRARDDRSTTPPAPHPLVTASAPPQDLLTPAYAPAGPRVRRERRPRGRP